MTTKNRITTRRKHWKKSLRKVSGRISSLRRMCNDREANEADSKRMVRRPAGEKEGSPSRFLSSYLSLHLGTFLRKPSGAIAARVLRWQRRCGARGDSPRH